MRGRKQEKEYFVLGGRELILYSPAISFYLHSSFAMHISARGNQSSLCSEQGALCIGARFIKGLFSRVATRIKQNQYVYKIVSFD